LPDVLREVREFRALTFAEQPEIFGLFAGINDALNNQFIAASTEYGVKRWEKILSITPKATYTLDERKFTVLTRLAERLPHTVRMLERMLTELCGEGGFKINLDAANYALTVLVALTAANNFNDVGAMLKRVCPANLVVELSIEYNQYYKLRPFRHADLRPSTHYQLRNEVL
jgi:hypothetical protein